MGATLSTAFTSPTLKWGYVSHPFGVEDAGPDVIH